MKTSKLLTLALLSMVLTTQCVSAAWRETGNITSDNGVFEQIVLDKEGNATALWFLFKNDDVTPDPHGKLSAATLKANTNKWVQTNNFTHYPNEFIPGPHSEITSDSIPPGKIIISNEGIVACTWHAQITKTPTTTLVKSSRLLPGSQTWEAPKTIATLLSLDNINAPAGDSSIAYDKNSRLYVIYADSSKNPIMTSAYLDPTASTWSSLSIPQGPTKGLRNYEPVLSVNPSQDRIVAIWNADGKNKNNIYGAFLSLSTNTWSTPILLSNPNKAVDSFQINQANFGIDNNYAVASWTEINDNDTYSLKYATLNRANKWTTGSIVITNTEIDTVSTVIDSDLNTTFVYVGYDVNFVGKIYAIEVSFKGIVSKPVPISVSYADSPKIVSDPSGKKTVMYRIPVSDKVPQYGIAVVTQLPGEKWSKPIKISNQNSHQDAQPSTNLFANVNGTVAAIWGYFDGILTASINKGNLPLAPTCIKGKEGREVFLLQKEALSSNKIKWCKSPSANVVSYNVYRNFILMGTVKASESLVFNDPNIKKGVVNVYSVRAVDAAHQRSEAVYVTLP